MRLVSALYPVFHPFDTLDMFDDFVCLEDPALLEEGDVLIIHGGADISPALYGKGRSSSGGGMAAPSYRDRTEWALMQTAKEKNIPIIGICRGAQLLCALEGGHLIQHINNHSGSHEVQLDAKLGFKPFVTNSIHHQQLVPAGNFELVAWTPTRSKEYWDVTKEGWDNILKSNPLGVDPEFVYYPNIKGFAIQWHPEMMDDNTPANQFVTTFIKNHV